MHYERLLTDLRKAGHENRMLCRTMTNTMARADKVLLALVCVLGVGEGDLLHGETRRVGFEYFAKFSEFPYA